MHKTGKTSATLARSGTCDAMERTRQIVTMRRVARQAWEGKSQGWQPSIAPQEVKGLVALQDDWHGRYGQILDVTGRPLHSLASTAGLIIRPGLVHLRARGEGIPWTDGLHALYVEGAELTVRALARRVSWQPKGRVLTALKQKARDEERSYDQVKHEALTIGLMLALPEGRREQSVRLGEHWIKTEHGKIAVVLPIALSHPEFARWWRKEIINAAEAFLLDEAYPRLSPGSHDVLSLSLAWPGDYYRDKTPDGNSEPRQYRRTELSPDLAQMLPDPQAQDPCEVLVAQETIAERSAELAAVLACGTESQRNLLHAALGQLEHGGNLDRAALAQELGITPETVRGHFRNLREKVRGQTRA
jgi:hypothetical protein